jgi:hypothetical protein
MTLPQAFSIRREDSLRKLARIGVLVLSLLGMAGTLAPTPAEATTVGAVVFNGNAFVHGHGIAFPFIDSDGPTGPNGVPLDLNKTPLNLSNSASLFFTSTTCVAAAVNVAKEPKPPVEAGLCTITATGNVHGYCGLSEGQVSGVIAVAGSGTYSFQAFAEVTRV